MKGVVNGVAPLLEMRGISKSFPGVRALDDVSLSVNAGEVHCLLGQNGAGKSTLMRVLCGAQHPDAGEILLNGAPVRLKSPADARRLGIAVIFQEFSLVPYLDIAQNIFLGRERRGSRMHAEARRLLDMLGVGLDTRTLAHLVHWMIGRKLETTYRQTFCERPGDVVLEVRELDADNGVEGASLTVRAGEVVGLAGLVGAGRSELARAIFGADRVLKGSVRVNGRVLAGKAGWAGQAGNPVAAVRAGVGLVPENRKAEGLALTRSVQDNVVLAGMKRLFPRGWYFARAAGMVASDIVSRLKIATPSVDRLTRYLSGGNQQKVVIGKWFAAGSRFFIFDEPTRGIDVGAKAEIYGVIEKLVADGAAVLMISSELPEMVAVCDRAYVMRDKRIVGELRRHELSETNILKLAMHHNA